MERYADEMIDVYFSTYDYGLKGNLDGFVPPKPDVFKG